MLKLRAFKFFSVVFASFCISATASAQDITAIDFTGRIIGKVIPDGTAVNTDNEIIGQLTADSLILNSKGDFIGGIVPQGFVIGNDHKYFGAVVADGTVRLPSGRIAGKVLPNGLAIDNDGVVIGGVLSGGIVYNDNGQATGRLAGNGLYVNFEGQEIGFVSATGYAYQKTSTGYTLDGRLLTAKTVVSLDGGFIGTVAPGGSVSDFEGHTLGRIHANGYVYDTDGKIVGATAKKAYAFDNEGSYLGLVSYNGDIVHGEKMVGRLRADRRVADANGKVIGFIVDVNAVAVDENGNYLGYLADNGRFMKSGAEPVGFVGARGNVLNANGQIIGQIADKGPVFDYIGNLKGEGALNGQFVSAEGINSGYMHGHLAFDFAGFLVGGTIQNTLLMDATQNVLTVAGIDSSITLKGMQFKLSPFGYIFNTDNHIVGNMLDLAPSYDEYGNLFANISLNGDIDLPTGKSLRLDSNGYVVDEKGEIKAIQINPKYLALADPKNTYKLSQTNVLYDLAQHKVAKIVPEYQIVSDISEKALLPTIGAAGKYLGIVVNVKGELVGYVNHQGQIVYQNLSIGHIKDNMEGYNQQNIFVGSPVPFRPLVNRTCENIGIVGVKGEARNLSDSVLGKVLANGHVISQAGEDIGHIPAQGAVFGFDGKIIGTTNVLGRVLNETRQSVGCVQHDGRFYEDADVYRGRVAVAAPVMNFDGQIIGRTNLQNRFVDSQGNLNGYATPDGTVKNSGEDIVGVTFLYQFAFDKDNHFMGRVTGKGEVLDDKGETLGRVTYDGVVASNKKAIGYALYDLYIYNDAFNAIGYITKNGTVVDFTGVTLGKSDRGFLVSKDGRLIGRGNRDYIVRNKKNEAVGELKLSGEMIDFAGKLVGSVSKSGEVRDQSARLVGTAKPLQYYIYQDRMPMGLDQGKDSIQVEPISVPQNDKPIPSYTQKVVGVVLSPDGKYLGDLFENGAVVDPNTGAIIGYNKEGLVFDESENLIGVVEQEKPTEAPGQVSSQIYLPSDAYGISDKPSNLGPGGGFGPNERYDPVRARLLAEAQNVRQSGIRVGKLTSNINPSSFTGTQSNWDDANYVLSSWRVDMSEMILADKPIPAVLARTIMDSGVASQVPVTAIVERNVYAEDGRNIVIPAGSRVMGQAANGASSGGTSGSAVRMDITWTRLIRPDGSAFEFSAAQTGDAQGRGGALGYLDEQLLKKYTLPMATSLMSDALAFVMARGSTTTSSDGTTTQDARAQAAQDAREHFLDNMNQIFEDLMESKTRIAAVTYIPAGTRLIIYPKVDMWIRTADREKEDAFGSNAVQKPNVLIDDSNPMADLEGGSQGSGQSTTTNDSGNTKVFYCGDDEDLEPATPLLDDSQYNKPRKRSTIGMMPPPSATSSTSSNDTPKDTSSGQLF